MGDSRVGLEVRKRNLTGFGEEREDLEEDVERTEREERDGKEKKRKRKRGGDQVRRTLGGRGSTSSYNFFVYFTTTSSPITATFNPPPAHRAIHTRRSLLIGLLVASNQLSHWIAILWSASEPRIVILVQFGCIVPDWLRPRRRQDGMMRQKRGYSPRKTPT
jgi:hypothetical protein